MKNIQEILKSIGVEIPEDKKEDFEKAFNENYKTVNELEKVKSARDNFKSRLDTATDQLKAFEGVDVEELQGKITKLNDQLETQKTDFEKQLADRDFFDDLDKEIAKRNPKNPKAVRGLIDAEKIEELKNSKNRSEDMKAVLDGIQEENDFLFGSKEPLDNGKIVGQTNGKTPKSLDDISKMSYDEYKEYRKNN